MASKPIVSSAAGFTLLETIIAMAIMVIAFASILSVVGSGIDSAVRAKQSNIVAMLARNTMVQMEYKFEGHTFDEIKKEDAGVFPTPYQDYRWQTAIKEITFPNLNFSGIGDSSSSSAGNSQDAASDTDITTMITKLITQYFSKALREVTVTILWKKGPGDQRYSVSTYWVDLNHEFQITEQ